MIKDFSTERITLGILGGGQLGRMSAMAAARLGIPCIILTPEEDSPASHVAKETIVADYTDETALEKFAAACDVITYEFENIPVETVRFLKTIKPVFPDDNLLEISQDRIKEKSYLNSIGIKTAKWAEASKATDIATALDTWNTNRFILKTTRFGYDGKGQMLYDSSENNIPDAWEKLGQNNLIIEDIVPFECEISIIIARGENGDMATYGPMVNEHENHILSRTTIPANLPENLCEQAIKMATSLATEINLRGVLTLELFVTKDGELLANEIAPRTHNSGHWSIDACSCSQFENHIRAVCGLPLGDAEPHSAAEMLNLIGQDIEKTKEYADKKGANIHLYGKSTIREGRKMGHITLLTTKD